jgi:hypothetical protein
MFFYFCNLHIGTLFAYIYAIWGPPFELVEMETSLMNSLFRCLIKSVGFLGLWTIIFPNMGVTYDSIPAVLTANTYLREAPDKNGKIIVIFKKGDRIFVQDENPQWANVVYDKIGHKINGWVAAKYLLKTATAPQELKAKGFEDKPANQAPQSIADTGFADPPPPPERNADTAEKQKTIVSEPLTPSDKTVANKATRPLSGDDVSSIFKNKVDNRIKAEDSNLESEHASSYGLIGVITRFLFKISLVIMSCVALIFSYSALQIAKSNRHAKYVDDGEKIIR